MLARTLLATILVAQCATVLLGQQPHQPSEMMAEATVVSYLLQDEESIEEPAKDFDEQFRKMEVRLRELEYDFENKLKSTAESNATTGEANEILLNRISELENRLQQQQASVNNIESTIPGFVRTGHNKPWMTLIWANPH